MFRKAIILGIILPLAVFIGKMIVIGVSSIKPTEFKPIVTIFLLDISASSRNLLTEEQNFILRMAKRLDSEDHTRIYVVTEDAYEVYDGNPHKTSSMREAMNKRSEYDKQAYGTAYGVAIKKAVDDALIYKAKGYTPAIVVLGDLENEGAVDKQINWNTLPKNIKNTLKYIPDLSLTFLYADPKKLDEVRQVLIPVFTEANKTDSLIFASEENVEQALRKFSRAVGR